MPAAASLARVALAMFAVCATAALTGCIGEPDSSTPPPTSPASESATPEPSEEPTAAPDVLTIDCANLVDPDAVYAFNPNLALLGEWDPDAGTLAADAVAAGGVACRWVLESGGGTMDVSVARFTEETILELKNEAFTESEMVPTYGEEAYFEVENGVGTAIVFEGRFRLVVTSDSFVEPGEPTEIIESALAALSSL